MERWAEYINDLFNDDRIEKPTILKNMDGPKILKSEVESSLRKLKRNKAAGPDEVVTEMMIALEDYGIDKLTDIVNEIYDTGVIPEDLSRSIFIALPKKPGATECELHRTISLMSHMTKLILRIIMMRARSRIRPEIGREQCGFVEELLEYKWTGILPQFYLTYCPALGKDTVLNMPCFVLSNPKKDVLIPKALLVLS